MSEDKYYDLRHSTAHLMAQAVGELFPGVKYAIGPPIDDGFYYDMDFQTSIGEDDLGRIEERMHEISAREAKEPDKVTAWTKRATEARNGVKDSLARIPAVEFDNTTDVRKRTYWDGWLAETGPR